MVNVSELDALLIELGRRRFRLFQFQGDRSGPDVFAGVYDWTTDLSDVLILRSEQSVSGDDRSRGRRVPTAARGVVVRGQRSVDVKGIAHPSATYRS
jgi:hypothetical protein